MKTPLPTLVVDNREPPHTAWTFGGVAPLVRATLKSGDYSVQGLETRIVVERKSGSDFLSTLTQGRDRFDREIERLALFERAIIVVEGIDTAFGEVDFDFRDVVAGNYERAIRPQSLVGSIGSFFGRANVSTFFAGNRRCAEIAALAFLLKCAKHLGAPAATVAA